MLIVHVHAHVKADCVEAFKEASVENARQSMKEPGIARFDVIQQADDPDRFVLYEVYRDEAGAKAHKQTAHYARWRQTVEPWMAEPRRGVQYFGLFPPNAVQWATKPG